MSEGEKVWKGRSDPLKDDGGREAAVGSLLAELGSGLKD